MSQDDEDQPKWILVVDDEPAVRQFVERVLNYAGYAVTTAVNGVEAMKMLEQRAYDLMLTDVVMPEMDGLKLAQNVSQKYPQTKILIMSGYANQQQQVHKIDSISYEVISKPFTLEEISRHIGAALAA